MTLQFDQTDRINGINASEQNDWTVGAAGDVWRSNRSDALAGATTAQHQHDSTLPAVTLTEQAASKVEQPKNEMSFCRNDRQTEIANELSSLVRSRQFYQANGQISEQGLRLMQRYLEQGNDTQTYEEAIQELQRHLNRELRGATISPVQTLQFRRQGIIRTEHLTPPLPDVIRMTLERTGGARTSSPGHIGPTQYTPHNLRIEGPRGVQALPIRFQPSWIPFL